MRSKSVHRQAISEFDPIPRIATFPVGRGEGVGGLCINSDTIHFSSCTEVK